jgi:uncharacterized protein (UPF0332 family)
LDPREFIRLASNLTEGSDEARWRSAVSRAYYGLFHLAGEKLEALTRNSDQPFRWTGRRKGHAELRLHWDRRAQFQGSLIANALARAYHMRNVADYELNSNFTKETVTYILNLVGRTAEQIKGIESIP